MLSYIKLNAFHFDLINVSQKIKVKETQLSVEQKERVDCPTPKCHNVWTISVRFLTLSHIFIQFNNVSIANCIVKTLNTNTTIVKK